MSYDLFFYKKKDDLLTKNDIIEFLNQNLTSVNENGDAWSVENEEAETYYSIEYDNPDEDLDEESNEFP
jgi:hypothetical protein